jgi:hypothetical protein
MGGVSDAIPSTHPWIAIVYSEYANCHEQAFARAAGARAFATALGAAKAMARTAIELLSDATPRESVIAEWRSRDV